MEDSADDHQTTKRKPIRRAKKGPKRLRSRAGSKTVNQKVIKSTVDAVVTLAKASRPIENGQEIAQHPVGEKQKAL